MALALAYKLCITQICLLRNGYDKIINIKYDTNRERINANFEFYSTRILDVFSHYFGSLFLSLSLANNSFRQFTSTGIERWGKHGKASQSIQEKCGRVQIVEKTRAGTLLHWRTFSE